MRNILLSCWLVLPVGAWAYHEGPGRDCAALEATSAVAAAAYEAAEAGDWELAVREYQAALEALPADPDAYDERVGHRLVLELNKARMQSQCLIEARDELASLVETMQAAPDADDAQVARQVLLQYDQAQTRLLVGGEAARLRFENHCFRVGYGFAEVGAHFPPLKLLVEGPGGATATVELGAQNYLFEHPTTSGVVCVGVLDNGPDGGVVLGGITMADVLVMHDNENGRIGWLPRDCGALPQS